MPLSTGWRREACKPHYPAAKPSFPLTSREALGHGSSSLPASIHWRFRLCRVLMLVQSCATHQLDHQVSCFHFQTHTDGWCPSPRGQPGMGDGGGCACCSKEETLHTLSRVRVQPPLDIYSLCSCSTIYFKEPICIICFMWMALL